MKKRMVESANFTERMRLISISNRSLHKLNNFYGQVGEPSYSDTQVDRWLERWFWPLDSLPQNAQVLDLACGDGVWSFGLLRKRPDISVIGIDISSSAIGYANLRLKAEFTSAQSSYFCVGDLEQPFPWLPPKFDLIFGRGLFIFNQHDFCRPGALALLRYWHGLLKYNGLFVSMYGSREDRIGTYTPFSDTRGMPANAEPRESPALDFRGGKFNHSPGSFISPFVLLEDCDIVFYSYRSGRHTMMSKPSGWHLEES